MFCKSSPERPSFRLQNEMLVISKFKNKIDVLTLSVHRQKAATYFTFMLQHVHVVSECSFIIKLKIPKHPNYSLGWFFF